MDFTYHLHIGTQIYTKLRATGRLLWHVREAGSCPYSTVYKAVNIGDGKTGSANDNLLTSVMKVKKLFKLLMTQKTPYVKRLCVRHGGEKAKPIFMVTLTKQGTKALGIYEKQAAAEDVTSA